MQFCHGIQKNTPHWPLSSLFGSCFPPTWVQSAACLKTRFAVSSLPEKFTQCPANANSNKQCSGHLVLVKPLWLLLVFLGANCRTPLRNSKHIFRFKELFRTRAGASVWKLPRDIYKMFARGKGEAKNRRESSGRSKQSLWCVSSINSRESKQTGQSRFSSNKTAICSLDNKHILDISQQSSQSNTWVIKQHARLLDLPL